MSNLSEKEFMEKYGRKPMVSSSNKARKIYWNRIIIALIILILLIIGIVQAIKGIANHFSSKSEVNDAVVSTSESIVDNKADVDEITSQLQFKVCIDPGHGDYDGGTQNADGTRLEKDDNLKIGLLVQKYLQEAGATVIMTRTDDTFIELSERCDIANDANADFFVSLHRNSYDGVISGVETWVYSTQPNYDSVLGNNIMTCLSNTEISEDRGLQYGYIGSPNLNYYINANTQMPSCLVELGFLTDYTDNTLFDKNVESYAKAISDAIIKSAKDLKVIDQDGNRVLNQQLRSEDKIKSEQELSSNDIAYDDSDVDFPTDGHMVTQDQQIE